MAINKLYLGKKRLPDEYQEVEYIQTDGNSWINCGFVPNNTNGCEFYIKFYAADTLAMPLFQSRLSSGSAVAGITGNTDGSIIGAWSANKVSTISRAAEHLFEAKATISTSEISLYVKDITTGESATDTATGTFTDTFTANTGLFGNTAGQFVATGYKVYSAYYSENGTKLRNFVPCYRVSDNAIGMYDLVNLVFYENAGTGTFTEGEKSLIPAQPKIRLSKDRLPDEYQQVEYIQSSGTQYINTGIIPSDATRIELDLNVLAFGTNTVIAGSRVTANDTAYNIFKMYSSSALRFDLSAYQRTTGTVTANTRYKLAIKNKVGYVDDTTYDLSSASSFTSSYPIYLFALNQANTATFMSSIKLYNCKIWQDGSTLSRNFIPCYEKSSGIIGLFDLVSKQFFTNQATGTTFEKGEAVEPAIFAPKLYLGVNRTGNDYQEVTYLKSNGNQYIDTGIAYADNTKYDIITTASTNTSWLMGWGSGAALMAFNNKWYNNSNQIDNIASNCLTELHMAIPADSSEQTVITLKQGEITETVTEDRAKLADFATVNFPLFKSYVSGVYCSDGINTMKETKIYVNDILERDFIPAYRKSDNAIGMLDIVYNIFYPNAGDSTFEKGADTVQLVCIYDEDDTDVPLVGSAIVGKAVLRS